MKGGKEAFAHTPRVCAAHSVCTFCVSHPICAIAHVRLVLFLVFVFSGQKSRYAATIEMRKCWTEWPATRKTTRGSQGFPLIPSFDATSLVQLSSHS